MPFGWLCQWVSPWTRQLPPASAFVTAPAVCWQCHLLVQWSLPRPSQLAPRRYSVFLLPSGPAFLICQPARSSRPYVIPRSLLCCEVASLCVRLPRFAVRLPCFAVRLPRFAVRLPRFAVRLPCFAVRLPCFAVRLPRFAVRLPRFAVRLPCCAPSRSCLRHGAVAWPAARI